MQPRIAESVCYVRSNKERALSRGDRLEEDTGEDCNAPIASARPATSAPAKMTCWPLAIERSSGVKQNRPLQHNVEGQIQRYLHPNGLFEYIRDNYPQLVSTST